MKSIVSRTVLCEPLSAQTKARRPYRSLPEILALVHSRGLPQQSLRPWLRGVQCTHLCAWADLGWLDISIGVCPLLAPKVTMVFSPESFDMLKYLGCDSLLVFLRRRTSNSLSPKTKRPKNPHLKPQSENTALCSIFCNLSNHARWHPQCRSLSKPRRLCEIWCTAWFPRTWRVTFGSLSTNPLRRRSPFGGWFRAWENSLPIYNRTFPCAIGQKLNLLIGIIHSHYGMDDHNPYKISWSWPMWQNSRKLSRQLANRNGALLELQLNIIPPKESHR